MLDETAVFVRFEPVRKKGRGWRRAVVCTHRVVMQLRLLVHTMHWAAVTFGRRYGAFYKERNDRKVRAQ